MSRYRFVVLLAVALAGCRAPSREAGAPGTSTPPPPPPASELTYLAQYVGRYPSDAGVWQSEPLRTRMVRLLGGDYEGFLENVRTSGPVSEDNGLIYVTGSCPSGARVWGAGVVVVDPAGDRVLLKQYSAAWDSVRTYADGQIAVLPKEVMTTLGDWADRPAAKPKGAPKKKAEETKG